MPEIDEIKKDLVDVGEEEGAEINLDEKGNPEKPEIVVEEKIEVEEVKEEPVQAKKEDKEDKKEELEQYSEGVQKRIAKLTRKMREAERQREEALTYAQSVKREKEEAVRKLSKVDKSYVSEFEKRVTTNLSAAKVALRNAIEAGDVDAQVAAQEQLALLSSESSQLGRLKTIEAEEAELSKKVNITPQQVRQPNNYNNIPTDEKAEDWASKNSWFGNDSAMTYTAFDIHKKLVEEEGYDPKSNEYYVEIDKRIRVDFPHKFDRLEGNTTERAKPAQNVASARRSAPTGRKNTVKLSPSQVAIAKRLGVPLEDYAKQKQLTEGN
mgnify:CR=1 FL=1|jgi:hypothetical protein